MFYADLVTTHALRFRGPITRMFETPTAGGISVGR